MVLWKKTREGHPACKICMEIAGKEECECAGGAAGGGSVCLEKDRTLIVLMNGLLEQSRRYGVR